MTGADLRTSPGAGAAGGVGFAAMACSAPSCAPASSWCWSLVGFADRLAGVDLVITGEGSLDEQTLHGKAVAGVRGRGRRAGIPVVAVCGRHHPRPRMGSRRPVSPRRTP